ncbi:hypothetical protein ACNKHQ_25345 [Shigella flexneri]
MDRAAIYSFALNAVVWALCGTIGQFIAVGIWLAAALPSRLFCFIPMFFSTPPSASLPTTSAAGARRSKICLVMGDD